VMARAVHLDSRPAVGDINPATVGRNGPPEYPQRAPITFDGIATDRNERAANGPVCNPSLE
jgi:hypothetical protein